MSQTRLTQSYLPILETIYQRYRETGIPMSYTFDDFRCDYARELLLRLPPEERQRGLPPEELARRLPAEERLLGLSDADLDRLALLLAQRKSGRH